VLSCRLSYWKGGPWHLSRKTWRGFFEISPKGSDAISGNKDILLPPLGLPSTSLLLKPCHRLQLDTNTEVAQKKKHTGRGSNPLSMVRDLLRKLANIVSKEQY